VSRPAAPLNATNAGAEGRVGLSFGPKAMFLVLFGHGSASVEAAKLEGRW
jgi:hypothetical protein